MPPPQSRGAANKSSSQHHQQQQSSSISQVHQRNQQRRKSVDESVGQREDEEEYDANNEIDMQPIEVRRTPEDQIQHLSEEQLNEVFTKVITATNPNVSKALTRFNYQEGAFKLTSTVTHLAVHFEMDGVLIHVDSDEAREQAEYISQQAEIEKKSISTSTEDDSGAQASARKEASTTEEVKRNGKAGSHSIGVGSSSKNASSGAGGDDDDEDEDDDTDDVTDDRSLKNQFNFSERASQTYNNPLRDREISTEPPPTTEFSGNVTHWDIFDAYVDDLEKSLLAKKDKDNQANSKASSITGAASGAGGVGGGAKRSIATDGDAQNGDEDYETNGNSVSSSLQPTAPSSGGKILDQFSTNPNLSLALKTMERMINQISEADLFQEYKYFEDKVEGGANGKRGISNVNNNDGSSNTNAASTRGSFLPLWKFSYEAAKRKTVTSIVWNPEYPDLFAVAYGSYDFMKQSPGIICCYSLKNTSYPEYKFTTESGIMSLDFHPVHTALLVAGLYDGTVCVYDIRSRSNEPIYSSINPKFKHTDPVWQVHFQKEEQGKYINFYSISTDGRVTNWIMNKNELINEEVCELKLMSGTKDHEEIPEQQQNALASSGGAAGAGAAGTPASTTGGSNILGLAGGCCFDFNPVNEHLFVVGTEEGAIQSYSKAYNTQFLRAFEGHHMVIYSIKWNPYHPHVFLTCSADWTVKLWEINTTKPVMTFDLSCSVGDIAWSPYSSTVFAVVTSDGKIRIFDLSINKHEPIGETRLNKKSKLTHVVFNPTQPIICVGDDRGIVNILKLSQNLRKTSAPSLEQLDIEEEIEKLDRLLIINEKDDESLFPLPAATANLLPQKKKSTTDANGKKKNGSASSSTQAKVSTPSTARIDPKKKINAVASSE